MHGLRGELSVQGSKNAVLPLLSACVLNRGENVVHGCPKIRDVSSMLEVMECAGARVRREADTLLVDTADMEPMPLIEKSGSTRSSVMLLGSFIARFRKAALGYPGGCRIGRRPIDLHEQALNALGVVFREEEDHFEAACNYLEGCDIYLPYPSVGVTENLLLAATGASGMTRIFGAAQEPEISELCRFLRAMGARIEGVGTGMLSVMGGAQLHGAEYTVFPDRIAAGTYLFAAAGAGGEIVLKNVMPKSMQSTLKVLKKLGACIRAGENEIGLCMNGRPRGAVNVTTAPYPGFPTDLQSPLLSVLCSATHRSYIEERIFENRFLTVAELKKMGADVRTDGRFAKINPAEKLHGASLTVRDLRGGAALVIAALMAEGESVISGAETISRGYEDITRDFRALGAEIYDINDAENVNL